MSEKGRVSLLLWVVGGGHLGTAGAVHEAVDVGAEGVEDALDDGGVGAGGGEDELAHVEGDRKSVV